MEQSHPPPHEQRILMQLQEIERRKRGKSARDENEEKTTPRRSRRK